MDIAAHIATELNIKQQQVIATISLLDQGDTVPFIARYRKEATQNLDDIQLRQLAERLEYLRQLEQRRQSILQSISQQGLLSNDLKGAIEKSISKTELEDLYLPFKPKRTSKASVAIAAGLKPLADQLQAKESVNPAYIAKAYINKKLMIETVDDALDGAAHIIIEQLAENAALLKQLRHWLGEHAILSVAVKRGQKDEHSKFRDYFEFSQPIKSLPSHRALAIFRGIKEGVLKLQVDAPPNNALYPIKLLEQQYLHIAKHRSQDYWLKQLAQSAWQKKLQPLIASDLTKALKERSEQDSIDVFATNLADLLMAAPAGEQVTLGLDPGFRSGVKVAVVSSTGDFLAQCVIYPHAPQKKWSEAIAQLESLISTHKVTLISIGNGTASRETEQLVKELQQPATRPFTSVMVSEAGASVYSASPLASKEFPDIDVSIRGAISIARRLQDPLAELVKIEPKAIGVGQYQHDVNQKALGLKLDNVVEDCVNKVGVNLNSASVQLLTQVAGISPTIAQNIVNLREEKGEFKSRNDLLNVPKLGAKSYQQCAGFLRVANSAQPLDNSAVHPESYALVNKMAASVNTTTAKLVGNTTLLDTLDIASFSRTQSDQYTVSDIIVELSKPGRDPRPEFKAAVFDDTINKLEDITTGMRLEGVITNVTNFGAFVDVGVHQDGLVHISQLANTFVKDPHSIVKTGQIVQVTVMEVDSTRKRLSFTMRS